MARQVLQFRITSECPILLHSGRTADPRDEFSKKIKVISTKKKKTDADLEEMSRLEWLASIYMSGGKIVIPGNVWESALVSGAKKLRLGKQVCSAISVGENSTLEFDGDNLPLPELWDRDQNRLTARVRVKGSCVMRTRFKAENWACDLKINYDDEQMDARQIEEILTVCGSQTGLCDWRPKYGRFSVKRIGS